MEMKIDYESPVSIFDGYESPWLNLPLNGNNTFTEQDNQQSSVPVHFNWFEKDSTNTQSVEQYYRHANISSTYRDKRMVHWNGNHGNIHLLMQNPNHEDTYFNSHQLLLQWEIWPSSGRCFEGLKFLKLECTSAWEIKY
eukprot:scaffold12018_cov431-Chaetoceros_neogracile.AAC.1